MSAFTGFPEETFDFLRELTEQNNKEWFTANRARYEAYYLAPALAFIEALGPRLQLILAENAQRETVDLADTASPPDGSILWDELATREDARLLQVDVKCKRRWHLLLVLLRHRRDLVKLLGKYLV